MPTIDYREARAEGHSDQDILDFIGANPGIELANAPASMQPGPPAERALGENENLIEDLVASPEALAPMLVGVPPGTAGGRVFAGAARGVGRMLGRSAEPGIVRAMRTAQAVTTPMGKEATPKAAGMGARLLKLFARRQLGRIPVVGEAMDVAEVLQTRAPQAARAGARVVPVRAHERVLSEASAPKLKNAWQIAAEENAKVARELSNAPKPLPARPSAVAPKPAARPKAPYRRRVGGGPSFEQPGALQAQLEASLRAQQAIKQMGLSPEVERQLWDALRQGI